MINHTVTVAEIGAEFRPGIARTVVATNGVDTVVLTRIGAIEEAFINIWKDTLRHSHERRE